MKGSPTNISRGNPCCYVKGVQLTGAVRQDAWKERTGIKTRNKCILNASISEKISEKFAILTGLVYDLGLVMNLWRKQILTLFTVLTTIQVCYAAAVIEELLSSYRAARGPRDIHSCKRRYSPPINQRYVRSKGHIGSHVLSKRIVGGRVSSDGAWPWQVALFLDGSQVCGGSLIADYWVLTACHCFTDYRSSKDPTRWKVKLGPRQTVSQLKGFEQVRRVNKIIMHPRYYGKTEDGVLVQPPDYDVALLRLSRPVTYDSHVLPICLATNTVEFPYGKICYITGWGTIGWNKPPSRLLLQAPIRIVSRDECNENKSYNGTVPRTALCAGFQDGRVDACQKDSGGPLACEYDGRWYLVGVVSWGKRCALPNKYGVYADVRVLRPWIANITQQEGYNNN